MTTHEKLVALIQHGNTQETIAEKAGVKQPTISRFFTGESKRIYSDTAEKINDLYDQQFSSSQVANTQGI